MNVIVEGLVTPTVYARIGRRLQPNTSMSGQAPSILEAYADKPIHQVAAIRLIRPYYGLWIETKMGYASAL